MTDVTILHEAEVELWEAVAYYEDRVQGLGLDFETEIERSVRTIAEHPECWPLRQDGTRRYLTHRFPYLVVYAYENGHVWILAIAHCKRRPGYWHNRIRGAEQDTTCL
uniref:Plasmid stabilisation system protein n=1 Tax=Candidatus Kentrum sp. LPFa TaxID=2126335 RepID=A0A450XW05_9GAMM|nr:MAG: Plasmid stabilisation system protein [Candidatus Kentron sp. LPFa]VFK33453.1 MAG: Plasmid stabilisation system protein [Candidatus Kentron sp. LPFa]